MSLHHSDESDSSSSEGDENSKSAGTRTSTDSRKTDDSIEAMKEELAKKETIAVCRLRVVVITVLLCAAAAICLVVYFVTKNAEHDEFHSQYEGVAEKVIQSFGDIIVEMAAISGLGVAASAHSVDQKTDWPFATLSNFQQRAGNARALSGVLYVSINPLVTEEQLPAWEEYVIGPESQWIDDGHAFQKQLGIDDFDSEVHTKESWLTNNTVDPMHTFDEMGKPSLVLGHGQYIPRWQTSPVLKTSMVNEDLFLREAQSRIAEGCFEHESAVLGSFATAPPGPPSDPNPGTAFFATLRSIWEGKEVNYLGDPMAHLHIPIFDYFNSTERKVVGVMISTIHWRAYLRKILPSNVFGITVVLHNHCDGFFTYEIHGEEAYVVGFGDQHEHKFNAYERKGFFNSDIIKDGTLNGIKFHQENEESCLYDIHVYPTEEYHSSLVSNQPMIITVSVAMVFVFTILMFLVYDRLVERRQTLVLAKATQSTAIVSSLFPRQVRDRLLNEDNHDKNGANLALAPNHRLKTFLDTGNATGNENGSQPIADLFPNCTVFFSDIAGFTAWSSTREPAQVFVLLQSVYQAFDTLAKRRKVFKVETIGDSYVAVTGLPEPQDNHAIIMARFAYECLLKMDEVTKELEVSLGPDTCDLSMRFGLHSGPVTAGVLRGERARFQLFGDTVNTASRMETTGVKGKIQVSQATADLVNKAGKGYWLQPREDKVQAKGKGVLDTFWLNPSQKRKGSTTSSQNDSVTFETAESLEAPTDADVRVKQSRLVEWMVELLVDHIKKIVADREAGIKCTKENNETLVYNPPEGVTCLDEVKEVIQMPKFDKCAAMAVNDHLNVAIDPDVISQLREYIAIIASAYRDNPFHNFEHACHVTMSVDKLLKRITAPNLSSEELEMCTKGSGDANALASHLHDFTHGINSNPMALFAITFSGLIHDVDHRGVSNMQLAKEEPEMGELYRQKSVAEQNSIDVAWDVLMTTQFDKLRKCIFGTQAELRRFRQLIVNVVLATDIFDKELNDLRKVRWGQAFSVEHPIENVGDLRASIVIEHIIQASDVSHTMQHWHVYQKWNRKLFKELYAAYKAGRMGVDPSTFWYKGELGFFDNYIIPLAKKLKECNVFGVSSDEYLNYAVLNRAEWEERGQEVVEDVMREIAPSYYERVEESNPLNPARTAIPWSTARPH